MGFMVRRIAPGAKLGEQRVLDALAAALPPAVVRAVVDETGVREQRGRKLPAELVVLLAVAMTLYPREALERVLGKLLRGLRFVWPDPTFRTASKGAICQARYHLGARPLVALFHRVCRPLATPEMPGAFLFGLRVVALDATTEDVPDTPANGSAFGAPSNQHGRANFPQVLGCYLIECGTHAFLDAGFWPCHAGEAPCARRLLRSVRPGMLLTWDAGLHSHAMVAQTLARGAHGLGRVPSYARLPALRRLADGSYLAELYAAQDRQRRGPPLLVRIVAYTITDPARPGAGLRHRLLTSLLNPNTAPAIELICAYHERWEIELVIDEQDTHQRLVQHPLRSKKPVGIIQELYGMLLAHYAIRAIMAQAAARIPLDPRRLSFAHAVQLITDAIPDFQKVRPSQRPALYQRLLADIAAHRLPPRANRQNPRLVKRTRAKYPPKRNAKPLPPLTTACFREAVQLLI